MHKRNRRRQVAYSNPNHGTTRGPGKAPHGVLSPTTGSGARTLANKPSNHTPGYAIDHPPLYGEAELAMKTVVQLKEIAKMFKITGVSNVKKADLVELIYTHSENHPRTTAFR